MTWLEEGNTCHRSRNRKVVQRHNRRQKKKKRECALQSLTQATTSHRLSEPAAPTNPASGDQRTGHYEGMRIGTPTSLQGNTNWTDGRKQGHVKLQTDRTNIHRVLEATEYPYGNDTQHSPYVYDHQGNKHYQDMDKEDIQRRYWQNTFRITNEENWSSDERNVTKVQQEIDHAEGSPPPAMSWSIPSPLRR